MQRPESRAYTFSMAERARDVAPEDAPPVDPHAVSVRYRREKAKRRARVRHRRATKWAGFRFWLVVLALVAASIFIVLVLLREVEQLFGL